MIRIPYVDRLLDLDIPPHNLAFDVGPCDTPAGDLEQLVHSALAHPVGAEPLAQAVQPGQRVIIICDDNTRMTPARQIIPLLLDVLNRAGVPDRDIQLIISSGSHRAMTAVEIQAKYGPEVMGRIPVLTHRYRDPDSLVSYGTTARGIRIFVNRHVVEAGFRIAVGTIIPHHPAGWSAGAKAVLPGVAGEETVSQMHFLGSRDPALGRVDTEMRREMEDFAARIGLDYILNVVLNRQGQVVNAVAGHFVAAHRAGIEASRRVWGAPIPELADLTLSSTSPVDFDFSQADKGVFAAELATRAGGEIVLVSGCVEGVSPAHPDLADYVGRLTNDQIWAMLLAGKAPDPLTGAQAVMINAVKEKMRITLATEGISAETCAALGFGHVHPDRLNAYVAERMAARPDTRVGVLRFAADILPILTPASA